MTTIYLIRHAEAEGNLYRRVQGHYDGRITGLGRQQIQALAERFRSVPLDALYSSDLSRTRETAGAILKYHDLPLIIDPTLREICMGVWENQPWGDVERDDYDQLYYFNHDPDRWEVPGGEIFEKLNRRITGAILRIAAENDGRTVAVVSHGMAIRTFLCGVLGIPSAEVEKMPHGDNTSVSLLEVEDGRISVVYSNDNSHLGDTLSTFAKQSWWKSRTAGDQHNLRFEPLELPAESTLYTDCYGDAWRVGHGGSIAGFVPEYYLHTAEKHAKAHPKALMKAMERQTLAGVVELDTEREAGDGVGWISLCYIVPELRGRRYGVQLIGHAAAVYKALGRRCLRLHVARSNPDAEGFYRHYGFVPVGQAEGVSGRLLVMEMEL